MAECNRFLMRGHNACDRLRGWLRYVMLGVEIRSSWGLILCISSPPGQTSEKVTSEEQNSVQWVSQDKSVRKKMNKTKCKTHSRSSLCSREKEKTKIKSPERHVFSLFALSSDLLICHFRRFFVNASVPFPAPLYDRRKLGRWFVSVTADGYCGVQSM